jgi:protein-disulfide isomerase
MSRKRRKAQAGSEPAAPPASRPGRSVLLYAAVAALAIAVVAVALWAVRDHSSSGGAARQAALASTRSPTIGEPAAKVHVVEFLDPACETCAQFYPLVKRMMEENAGRIRLSVRHVAFHDGSDYVVRLLEASRKQDRYWQTLETLLQSQSQWAPDHVAQPELVGVVIEGLGLDAGQLKADMNSPDVAERVQQDANDAVTMKVTATPEYFVNGRPLPSFGEQQLLNLVNEELQRAY